MIQIAAIKSLSSYDIPAFRLCVVIQCLVGSPIDVTIDHGFICF